MIPVTIWKFTCLPWYKLRCPRCGTESVKRTKKGDREKAINTYIPIHAYYCERCRYRFYNVVTLPIKTMVIALIAFFFLVFIVVFLFFREESILETLGRSKRQERTSLQEPVFSTRTPSGVEPGVLVEARERKSADYRVPAGTDVSRENRYAMKETPASPKEDKIIAGTIKIGNSDTYGIHWIDDIKGLRITRISAGPMMKSGIKVNDIIVSINGAMVLDSDLVKLRDDIRSGNRRDASMEIFRDGKILSFTVER